MLTAMRYGCVAVALGLTVLGCDEESRACRSEFERAQVLVRALESESPIETVRESVAALDAAVAACEKAGLGHEKGELEKARSQVAAHLDLLERRARRKKRVKPSPEELAALVKNGDPTCPKGQAYLSRELKKEIQCKGPQIVEMKADELKGYFEERKYRLTSSDAPPTLRAEYGAELYVFTFDAPGPGGKVRCLEIYPAPGVSWQELTSRMTGAAPERLKPGASVATALGALPLSVEESEKKTLARIGECQR
jgi:hypothetical protein